MNHSKWTVVLQVLLSSEEYRHLDLDLDGFLLCPFSVQYWPILSTKAHFFNWWHKWNKRNQISVLYKTLSTDHQNIPISESIAKKTKTKKERASKIPNINYALLECLMGVDKDNHNEIGFLQGSEIPSTTPWRIWSCHSFVIIIIESESQCSSSNSHIPPQSTMQELCFKKEYRFSPTL